MVADGGVCLRNGKSPVSSNMFERTNYEPLQFQSDRLLFAPFFPPPLASRFSTRRRDPETPKGPNIA